jgi:beta-glucosidase
VAKSLVLLKNDGVLPVKPGANVLVAGAGADDIGKASGGWTLTWQGTGNKNSDFPTASRSGAASKEAVKAAGGQAELSRRRRVQDQARRRHRGVRRDALRRVPGRRQDALEYQPGDKTDLALLKKLKAGRAGGGGVPVGPARCG